MINNDLLLPKRGAKLVKLKQIQNYLFTYYQKIKTFSPYNQY